MKRLFQTKLFVFIFAILTGGATISCHEEKIGNDSGIDSPDGNDGSTLPDHGGGSSKPEMGDEITAVDGTKLEELSKWTVTPHTNPGLFVQDEAFSNEFDTDGKAYGSNWLAATQTFETIDFHPENVMMKDGNLNVTIRHNEHDAPYGESSIHMYFQSGMLRSKSKTTYGYYEAKIKGAHVSKGTCSAFWLYNIPWEKVEGEPYPRKVVYNEIDVVELQQVPKDLHIMSCNYHIMVLKDDCVSKDFIRPDDMWGTNECLVKWDSRDDYHLYACENRPDSIIWYIDNRRVASKPNYYWHLPMYVVLSVEPRTPFEKYVNGERFPVPTTKEQADAAGFPSTMKVDYIRTWRRKDYSQFKSSKREYNPNDF